MRCLPQSPPAWQRFAEIELAGAVGVAIDVSGLMTMPGSAAQESSKRVVDEIDRARAGEYALLATLLSHSPDSRLISRLAGLQGDDSPIGMAHTALGKAAGRVNEEDVMQEYFALFAGLGQGQLLPYSSHYLTGSLYGRPLAQLRETLQRLGIEKAPGRSEPEDHAATLCEVMAGLVAGSIAAPAGADRDFFEEHLLPWIGRFFVDLERAEAADFYRYVGSLGRTFIGIEAQAFALPA
jgi:TorA maturation chaperone TorD